MGWLGLSCGWRVVRDWELGLGAGLARGSEEAGLWWVWLIQSGGARLLWAVPRGVGLAPALGSSVGFQAQSALHSLVLLLIPGPGLG